MLDNLITEISKSKSFKIAKIGTPTGKPSAPPSNEPILDKVSLFANRIGVSAERMKESQLIGINDDDIQIIKLNKFSPFESSMFLLAIKDLVFNEHSIAYEDWKDLCENNGVQSKTPFYKIALNAKSRGYIDKKKYAEKQMMLIPKGRIFVQKTIEKIL